MTLITPAVTSAEWTLRLTAGSSFLYALTALAASAVDPRTLGAENVWMKPLKFGISVAIYLATLQWALESLSAAWRQGRAAQLIAATASFCSLFELAYIGIQAARGQASHFNLTTPFYSAMYSLMAIAAVALALSGGALGIVIFQDSAANSTPVRWGVALAFLSSTALTILTGITMGGNLTHHVGLESAPAVRVPLTGWSLTVGDMRVPHFLATHLMQAGPFFAWRITRVASDRAATIIAAGFCLQWTALTLWLFRIVLTGRPFLAFFR